MAKRKPLRIPRGLPGAGRFASRAQIEKLRKRAPVTKPRKKKPTVRLTKRRPPTDRHTARLRQVVQDIAARDYAIRRWRAFTGILHGKQEWLSMEIEMQGVYARGDAMRWAESFAIILGRFSEYGEDAYCSPRVQWLYNGKPEWRSVDGHNFIDSMGESVADSIMEGSLSKGGKSDIADDIIGIGVDIRFGPMGV